MNFKFQFFFSERVSTVGTTRETSCLTFGTWIWKFPGNSQPHSLHQYECYSVCERTIRARGTRLSSGRPTAHLINHYNPKPAHPECITRGNLTATSFELGIEWMISTAVDEAKLRKQ